MKEWQILTNKGEYKRFRADQYAMLDDGTILFLNKKGDGYTALESIKASKWELVKEVRDNE